jgi:hypothetical protein
MTPTCIIAINVWNKCLSAGSGGGRDADVAEVHVSTTGKEVDLKCPSR